MLRLILLEIQIIFVARWLAVIVMDVVYPNWRDNRPTQRPKESEHSNAKTPWEKTGKASCIKLAEAITDHTYIIKWVRCGKQLEAGDEVYIFSNSNGNVLLRRKDGHTFAVQAEVADLIAVEEK